MINTLRVSLFLLIGLFIFSSCGKGIEPSAPVQENSEPGISGTINFTGDWPGDITITLLVLFKEPLIDSTDFNITNFAYISNPIPSGISSFTFNTLKDSSIYNFIAPGTYSYFAVAQSKKAEISLIRSDWFISGYYAVGNTLEPGQIVIPENSALENIKILCDFDNPPPQPPE